MRVRVENGRACVKQKVIPAAIQGTHKDRVALMRGYGGRSHIQKMVTVGKKKTAIDGSDLAAFDQMRLPVAEYRLKLVLDRSDLESTQRE